MVPDEQRSGLVLFPCVMLETVFLIGVSMLLSGFMFMWMWFGRNNKILYCFPLKFPVFWPVRSVIKLSSCDLVLLWKGLGDCAFYCAKQSWRQTSITSLGFQFSSCKFWIVNGICWIFNDLIDHSPFSIWSYPLVFCDWYSTIYCSNSAGAVGSMEGIALFSSDCCSSQTWDAFLYLQRV